MHFRHPVLCSIPICKTVFVEEGRRRGVTSNQYVSKLTIVQTRREKGIVCALLAWREGSLKKKSLLSELGKMREKNILLFIIGNNFKGINLFLKFGNLFRK